MSWHEDTEKAWWPVVQELGERRCPVTIEWVGGGLIVLEVGLSEEQVELSSGWTGPRRHGWIGAADSDDADGPWIEAGNVGAPWVGGFTYDFDEEWDDWGYFSEQMWEPVDGDLVGAIVRLARRMTVAPCPNRN